MLAEQLQAERELKEAYAVRGGASRLIQIDPDRSRGIQRELKEAYAAGGGSPDRSRSR